MENLKGKTAQDVFDAACRAYSTMHPNHAFSSFCDVGEIRDFVEHLRNELNIKPPAGKFVSPIGADRIFAEMFFPKIIEDKEAT